MMAVCNGFDNSITTRIAVNRERKVIKQLSLYTHHYAALGRWGWGSFRESGVRGASPQAARALSHLGLCTPFSQETGKERQTDDLEE